MTKERQMTNDELGPPRLSGSFVIGHSSFVIRHSTGRTPIRLILAAGLAAVLAAAGCTDIGGMSISAADQIVRPGGAIRVTTQVKRKGFSRWFGQSSPPPIRIYRNNELLGECKPVVGTREVSVDVTLDTPGEHVIDAVFQPRSTYRPIQATCFAYCWDATKVGIAVDLDRVCQRLTRADRFFNDVPLGEPREDAAAVLSGLARDFYICYLTALPPENKVQIREWLRANNLPVGPIFTWNRPKKMGLAHGDQADMLGQLRRQVDTLLIGIGDGSADLAAFTGNRMLPIMLEFSGPVGGPLNVPRCKTWQDVWEFFNLEANQPILADPKQMLELQHRGGDYVTSGRQRPSGGGDGRAAP